MQGGVSIAAPYSFDSYLGQRASYFRAVAGDAEAAGRAVAEAVAAGAHIAAVVHALVLSPINAGPGL
jgi:hypothetical protein